MVVLETKEKLGEESRKKEGQKTILDYNMGFRTRSRSGSNCSLDSLDNYATKKKKLKTVKDELVTSLKKVVEEKETKDGQLVIVESESDAKGKIKINKMILMNIIVEKDVNSVVSTEMAKMTEMLKKEIHAWTVPAMVERERHLADSWMTLTKSLVGNMKLIFNNQFAFTKKEDVEDNLQMLSAVEFDPVNLTIDQFWGHPASAPLWRFSRITQMDRRHKMWANWWALKVQTPPKMSPKQKLDQYLTAIDFFNETALKFWSDIAFNITYFSQERIVSTLTRLGDYLRLRERLIYKNQVEI